MNKIIYKWNEFDDDVGKIVDFIKKKNIKVNGIYGVPKGGLVLAVVLANRLNVELVSSLKYTVKNNVLIVDDICDSGKTLMEIPDICDYKTITLFKRHNSRFNPDFYCRIIKDDSWAVFCWESPDNECKRDGTEVK